MKKARSKTDNKAKAKPAAKAKRKGPVRLKKPVNLEEVRKKITDLVATAAVDMAQAAVDEAEKGHITPLKVLFEMIGLYPATEAAGPEGGEDSLARTLLRRLGLPEEPFVCPMSLNPECAHHKVPVAEKPETVVTESTEPAITESSEPTQSDALETSSDPVE